MRGRKEHQGQEKMGGQGMPPEEESPNQIMHSIFGDESEGEAEDEANDGDEAIGVKGNNHGVGDEANQNHNFHNLPARAAREPAYKANNRHHGHRLEEENAKSQGSAGLANGSVGEACRGVLGYPYMRENVEVMKSEEEGYRQRLETSRARVIASEFKGSKDNYNADEYREDNDVHRKRKSGSKEDVKSYGVFRDVFGESDEDEIAPYGGQDDTENDNVWSAKDEGHYGNILQGKDIVPGKNTYHESAKIVKRESKQCPVGPPLSLVVPHMPPPGQPDRMNVIKVSNVVGFDPKPFNPETYLEEDAFIDESEGRKRNHSNVVRWRMVKNADGTEHPESNARFVKWKDGSMQLLIGDEAFDVTVDELTHPTHLFMNKEKGLLQSQGKLLQKMRFMPSLLSSKSQRSLIDPVDSKNKKTNKMKTWYEKKDPEKVKQEMERAEEENIRARAILRKEREKVNRKYTQPRREKQNLTPGFLEEALHKNGTHGSKCNPHGRVAHTGFKHDLELEAMSERCIYDAKVHRSSGYERNELEYETELMDIERSTTYGRENELNEKNGYDQDLEEALGFDSMSNEEIESQEVENKREPRKRRKVIYSHDESPPPRKRPLSCGKVVVSDSDDE